MTTVADCLQAWQEIEDATLPLGHLWSPDPKWSLDGTDERYRCRYTHAPGGPSCLRMKSEH
jgi:hypothetical protein